MTSKPVVLTAEANADIEDVYDWLADRATSAVAFDYAALIQDACERLGLAPGRGTIRPDIGPGVRKTGLLGNFTVLFFVDDEALYILRIFKAGRNWETDMQAKGFNP